MFDEEFNFYAYRVSKAGLNMTTKCLSVDLKKDGILTTGIHPGWVKTDMGTDDADISIDTCVSTMVKTIMQLGEKDHGGYLSYENKPMPW